MDDPPAGFRGARAPTADAIRRVPVSASGWSVACLGAKVKASVPAPVRDGKHLDDRDSAV